ncbi:MAG: 5-formyltetrahydrofolate cyclo-ligase family protein [Candidatus Methanofastidiosum methylothiophilum]|uniref:5-formyltetrahydrofolate cyclo-ligase family protein n=1 Tax=Candidatus Methanofastidiosum methylothiophilum TaxID=1705564 RepID=A0A150J201_9EURY|nr:MAG: 5-formyltetrahydrofolate cyclo-ligase family protein [Candidatus Methanofastidiosum methylthiophilus]KYC48581.1 MAG: 5-formyltetrahydrofolate cyclo-ligase family protein [Candidatus Methanofastidiosum methylthiophilus]KYC51249.1 MAG: 5-formyltetrahydrofolate cyclo-ligase family protein [Candidatus Methanofastidiosum methylthiophilus]
MLSKSDIRMLIKEKMEGLDSTKKGIMDQKIRDFIYNLPDYSRAKNIFSYVSKEKEVDTIDLINKSIEIGKSVYVPLTIKENNSLEVRKITSLEDLKIGNFNILEPKDHTKSINPKEIEILFIPGLAFGTGFERLGRGGGYFDRFLLESTGLKVGLAYEFQIFESLPVQKHDVKMDLIITDSGIISPV